MNITEKKVQKIKFWLNTKTHGRELVSCFDFDYPVALPYVKDCLKDWASQFYGWYTYQELGFDTVGNPYVQKHLVLDIEEINSLLGLYGTEKLSYVSFDKEYDNAVTFVVEVNEPKDDES